MRDQLGEGGGQVVPDIEAVHTMVLDQQKRLAAVELQLRDMKDDLGANTAVTQQVQASTSDLVEIFNAMRGGLKVLEGLGKAARPLMYIGGAVSAGLGAWAAWKAHR